MAEKHVEVLRELRATGDVSDWRAFESALDAAISALSSPAPAQVDDTMVSRALAAFHAEGAFAKGTEFERESMRAALTAALTRSPQEKEGGK